MNAKLPYTVLFHKEFVDINGAYFVSEKFVLWENADVLTELLCVKNIMSRAEEMNMIRPVDDLAGDGT